MWLPDLLRRRREFRSEVIRSNSGVSSKSYVMVEGMQIAKVVVYWYLIVLTIEMFTDYVLRSNWVDFGVVLGALSGFVLATAWGKIKGEQSYYRAFTADELQDDTSINKEDGVI